MSRGSDRLRPVVLALAALLLAGWFSREISDTDFWWHLRTGQYLAERHTLPVPDPFAGTLMYTSSSADGLCQYWGAASMTTRYWLSGL